MRDKTLKQKKKREGEREQVGRITHTHTQSVASYVQDGQWREGEDE
jgi:hypothetical protein